MRNFITLIESVQNSTADFKLTEEISQAKRWGLIKRLRNVLSRGDVGDVESELQGLEYYKPWPEIDRVKTEYLNFVKNHIGTQLDNVLGMNDWLFELDVEWPELYKLIQDWAEQNRDTVLATVEKLASYGPARAAILIRNLKKHGIDWPEIDDIMLSNVSLYLKQLADDIRRNDHDHMLPQMSWTIIHIPQVQQWLNAHRKDIIRLLLIRIKKASNKTTEILIDRFIQAGFNWPELNVMKKSLASQSTN